MSAVGQRVGRTVEAVLFTLLLIPLARHAPRFSRALRPLFVAITWAALPGRRRALRRTARIVLGADLSDRECDRFGRRVMANIQAFIADVATIDRRSVPELAARTTRFEGLDFVQPFIQARRGVILAGAHLGSFESSMALLRSVSDVPVHVVFARDSLRPFERIRARARAHLGIVEQPVERGVATWLALRDALERGEVVAVLADRVLPGQRGTVMPFFGVPALLPTGPLRLAAVTGAPIVPTFAIPGEDGFQTLRFERPIVVKAAAGGAVVEMRETDRAPEGGAAAEAAGRGAGRPAGSADDTDRGVDGAAARELVGAMERAIRAAPEHWLVVSGPWEAVAPSGVVESAARPVMMASR